MYNQPVYIDPKSILEKTEEKKKANTLGFITLGLKYLVPIIISAIIVVLNSTGGYI